MEEYLLCLNIKYPHRFICLHIVVMFRKIMKPIGGGAPRRKLAVEDGFGAFIH